MESESLSSEGTNILLRLCHQCGHVSEGSTEVLRCATCGKGFLPLTSLSELLIRMSQSGAEQVCQNPGAVEQSLPLSIHGLVVFW